MTILRVLQRGYYYRPLVSFHWGDIFAIHSGFVDSGRGCRKRYYRAEGKDGEVVSSRTAQGFYLPYDDYRIYKR